MIDDLIEVRRLTPTELASLVIALRKQRAWTQEELAAFSGVSYRTIQRVESAEGSRARTKRALAKVFEYEDRDAFNKPYPILNEEKIEEKKLEETTSLVPLECNLSGRKLRKSIEGTDAMSVHEYTELSDEASPVFAQLQDYMRDYLDIYKEFSEVEKIQIDEDFQLALNELREMGITIGVAIRQTNHSIVCSVIYLVVGSSEGFPESIRLPKRMRSSF